MSNRRYTAGLPMPSAPLVEPQTGIVSDVWWGLLLSLFTRTGGAVGAAPTTALVITGAAVLSWPSASGARVAAGVYELVLSWPWTSGTITKLTAETGNGSFTAALMRNGVAVAGLAAVPVSSVTPVTTLAGSNTLAIGDNLTLAVTGVIVNPVGFAADFTTDFFSGTAAPTDATVQVTYSRQA